MVNVLTVTIAGWLTIVAVALAIDFLPEIIREKVAAYSARRTTWARRNAIKDVLKRLEARLTILATT